LRAHQHSLHSIENAFLSRNLNQIMPKNALFLGKNLVKIAAALEQGENPQLTYLLHQRTETINNLT